MVAQTCLNTVCKLQTASVTASHVTVCAHWAFGTLISTSAAWPLVMLSTSDTICKAMLRTNSVFP